ncbi:MAG: polysaccharide pyruvyl transferase family protein [Rhodospirillaceae bacterium]|nr:polysaccharide pyruvyl transferase family protein [Rhodospirillales bacterium]
MPVICLYTPFSAEAECRPLSRTPLARLRNRARRAADMALWTGMGQWQFHFSTYEDRANTNRGDSAIRLASRALIEQAFGDRAQIIELGWADFDEAAAERLNAQADLFVVGGGGYYFCDQSGRLNARIARDAKLLARLDCPVVSLCPGMNRNLGAGGEVVLHPDSLPDLKAFLAQLDLSSVRDHVTRWALAAVDGGRAVALADPALFLAPQGTLRRDDYGSLWVGLNLAFHGPHSTAHLHRLVDLVAQVAQRLLSRRRCRFFYFVHSDAELLIPSLLAHAGVITQVIDAAPAEMVAHYGLLDVHLAEMLHSVILCSNAGVPSVSLAYDVKHHGFAEMMGQEQWCLSIHDAHPDRVAGMLLALADRRHAISEDILARKAQLRGQMDDYLDRVAVLTVSPVSG